MITQTYFSKEAFRDLLDLIREREWVSTKEEEIMYLWELCDNEEQRNLLKELILDIYVLDNRKEIEAATSINNYINQLGISATDAWIVSVADSGEIDGSISGMQILKQKIKPVSSWSSRYVSHIPELIPKIKTGDSIFLFDDFIGSGNKFIKKYDWLTTLIIRDSDIDINTICIRLISFSGMTFGINNLVSQGHTVHTFKSLNKGISDKYSEKEVTKKTKLMLDLEKKLSSFYKNKKLSDFSLGYKQSESLYYWQNNSCPNNVFPVFWWPKLNIDKEHETLLVRVE